jgi:hypothetical protein
MSHDDIKNECTGTTVRTHTVPAWNPVSADNPPSNSTATPPHRHALLIPTYQLGQFSTIVIAYHTQANRYRGWWSWLVVDTVVVAVKVVIVAVMAVVAVVIVVVGLEVVDRREEDNHDQRHVGCRSDASYLATGW